jgi:hypothetical protein
MAAMDAAQADSIEIGGQSVEVWPAGTRIDDWFEPTVKVVQFPDTARVHPGLVARTLDLEHDKTLSRPIDGIAGCRKIYHLDRWGCPEADLVHARALELFKRAVGAPSAVVDLSWANIYRQGDYCMPHAHERALASVVYFLALGADDPEGAGRGQFCFADPRLKACCQGKEQVMTTPCGPRVRDGTMIIFPGRLVHFVDVYRLPGIRISMSWNINRAAIPGDPLPAAR